MTGPINHYTEIRKTYFKNKSKINIIFGDHLLDTIMELNNAFGNYMVCLKTVICHSKIFCTRKYRGKGH